MTTIGAMAIDTAYLSTKYGFLAFNNQNDKYELVQYKYDGEMITETVLVSASSEADYKSQADQYLADARELKAYALDPATERLSVMKLPNRPQCLKIINRAFVNTKKY